MAKAAKNPKSVGTPWKTDKWFVSPWNYEPEVVKQFKFPPAKDIKIHDISLRDGEQQAGIVYSLEDKVKIAKALAEAGVHRIEAGMPAVSKVDEAAIKEIVQLNLGPEIFAFSRCIASDVKLAKECGVKGIVVEIPSSEHIIKHAYGWELQKAIDLSIEATLLAKDLGLYTVWFPIDASRADMELVPGHHRRDCHERTYGCVGGGGYLRGDFPACRSLFDQKNRERVKKPLEPHFHDDFGMGVANTLIALACGCTVAHTTVTGIGERAGNAAMEELVLALLTMYGIDIGIKMEKFCSLSKLVRELSRTPDPLQPAHRGRDPPECGVGNRRQLGRTMPCREPPRARALHSFARGPEADRDRHGQEQRDGLRGRLDGEDGARRLPGAEGGHGPESEGTFHKEKRSAHPGRIQKDL